MNATGVPAEDATREDWLRMVAEYDALSRPAYIVTRDGEKISSEDARRRLEAVSKTLKQYMERTGETFELEGRGTLAYQDQAFGWWWALNDMHDNAPADFEHLLKERVLTVDNAAYDAAAKAGRVGGPERTYRHRNMRKVLRWLT